MMLDYNKVKRSLIKARKNDGADEGEDEDEDEAHSIRQLTLEFCGLCTTAFKLPQVEEYAKSGKQLSFCESTSVDNDDVRGEDIDDSTPQQRISHLQQMIICALGYE